MIEYEYEYEYGLGYSIHAFIWRDSCIYAEGNGLSFFLCVGTWN